MRILIAEDDAACRRILNLFLVSMGDCDAATDGATAAALFRQAMEQGKPYNLVCLDVGMPKLDGIGALLEMRRMEKDAGLGPEARAKIMMITASGESRDVLGAVNGGCDAYLVKPIGKTELHEQVRRMGLLEE